MVQKKDHMKACRNIICLLMLFVLTLALAGCAFITEETSIRKSSTQYESITIDRDAFFYEEADASSDVTGMVDADTKVKIQEEQEVNGLRWGRTKQGWVCLEGGFSDTIAVNDEYIVNHSGTIGYEGPGEQFEVKTEPKLGERVRVYQTTHNGKWLYSSSLGWINKNQVGNFEMEEGFAVVREAGAYIYTAPEQIDYAKTALVVADRVAVQYKLDVGGTVWWHYSGGWLREADIYIEGRIGSKPASGEIIDTTPLNVRRGPTKRYDVVTTMPVGGYASVMEQINCGGNNGTWGYTGKGWIYMPMVRIESNAYDPNGKVQNSTNNKNSGNTGNNGTSGTGGNNYTGSAVPDSSMKDVFAKWMQLSEPVTDESGLKQGEYAVLTLYSDGSFEIDYRTIMQESNGQWTTPPIAGPMGASVGRFGGVYTMDDTSLWLKYEYSYSSSYDGGFYSDFNLQTTIRFTSRASGSELVVENPNALHWENMFSDSLPKSYNVLYSIQTLNGSDLQEVNQIYAKVFG